MTCDNLKLTAGGAPLGGRPALKTGDTVVENTTTPRRQVDGDHGDWIRIHHPGGGVSPLVKVGGRGQGWWIDPLGRPVTRDAVDSVDPGTVEHVVFEIPADLPAAERFRRIPRRSETIARIEELLGYGCTPEDIARRLGVRPQSLRDTCRRATPPRRDLVRRMSPRPEMVRLGVSA